jgi:hypothetical protein
VPLRQTKGAGTAPLGGVTLKGKISYFGGPNDASTKTTGGAEKSTASGAPTSQPGIAVYNNATLGGYWKVTTPNGRTQVIRQTDIGPAPWTGRIMDFTYSSLSLFGYTESNFPTNGIATGVYLGQNRQAAMEASGDAVAASQRETSGGEVPAGVGQTKDASLLSQGESLLTLGQDLVTGNIGDLGGKLALASLSVVKGAALGFGDLIIAPGWHWNQRAAAYYSAYIINPRKIGDGSSSQWAFAWNAAFWGLGYVLFFTEEGKGLRPAPVHRTRLAHHVRKAQAIPARKSLIRPKDVKQHTPKKPKPALSKATVTLQNTMSTSRPRQVKVYASGGHSTNSGEQAAVTSGVPIEEVDTQTAQSDEQNQNAAQPDKGNHAGSGAHGDKRRAAQVHATKGSRRGPKH